ncbi:hypothetical protein ACFYNO_38610 [Kitasatospora sp. NPDC006697]|uniref:hypothetical protein n=1 Tax=Kitasatospora sp. NPDC006697 TaxID=3364020 RepID=UPI00369CFA93
MSADEQYEPDEQLVQLLGRLGEDYATDPHPLIAGGLARGRRRRRRRQALLACVAAVAVAAAVGRLMVGTPGSPSGQAASDQVLSAPATGAGFVSAVRMEQLLTAVLPAGSRTSLAVSTGTDTGDGNPSAELLLESGGSRLFVSIYFQLADSQLAGQRLACPAPGTPNYVACTSGTHPDGSQLTLLSTAVTSNGVTTRSWQGYRYGPGHLLTGFGVQDAPGTRTPVTQPPFSDAELTRMITDPSWADVGAAMVWREGNIDSPQRRMMPANEMLSALKSLVPSTAHYAEPGGTGPSEASLTVDDGNGGTTVDVVVRSLSVASDPELAAATRLPDGDLELVQEGTNLVGTSERVVELARTDGTGVIVKESNTGSAALAPHALALSLDQLTAVARSPRWHLNG